MNYASCIAKPLAVLAVAALSLGGSCQQQPPLRYAGLYRQLGAALDAFEADLDTRQPAAPRHVIFGTGLLAANCNRGEALLEPAALDTVRLCLDRFKEMGIGGVTVACHYPLFDPAFPRHDDYVEFFSSVADEVRSRGMLLDVESHVIFTDTPFSPVMWNWKAYTVDSLAAARRDMAQLILDRVRPDYLNLGTESDTEATLTGIADLKKPEVYVAFIGSIGQGLVKGDTKLGAGMGAWDDAAQGELLADEPWLDFLALHVYDLNPGSLQKALYLGEVARAHGKRLILDECWLYKQRLGKAGGVAVSSEIFKRDSYSFFAPLDQQFLRCMAKLAQAGEMEYVSAFWSTFFFASLDYTALLDALPYGWVAGLATKAEWTALQAGSRVSTGDYYKALIEQYP